MTAFPNAPSARFITMPPSLRSLGLAVAADDRVYVGSLRERSAPFEFPPDVG